MAEVLVRFTTRVVGKDGRSYLPQACGGLADDGLWEGWIEFISASGKAVCSPRETEQPNRYALVYWAEGLTDTYLQGALDRALTPRTTASRPIENTTASVFARPARGRPVVEAPGSAVLDPFATYRQGEAQLRRQLSALSRDHVVKIIRAYRLNVRAYDDTLTNAGLIEALVSAIRSQAGRSRGSSWSIEERDRPRT